MIFTPPPPPGWATARARARPELLGHRPVRGGQYRPARFLLLCHRPQLHPASANAPEETPDMTQAISHLWVVGPSRAARRGPMGATHPAMTVSCHARLRGPYSGI